MKGEISFDEIAEAEAQGLPYLLVPRELSKEEWMEKYGGQPVAEASPEDLIAPAQTAQPQ